MFQERIESKRRRNRLVGLIALFGAAFCLYFCLSFPQTTIPTDESTSSLYSSLRSYIRHGDAHSLVKRSTEFPSLDVSTEMARLSGMIYRFKHYNDCNATDIHGNPLLPPDLDCHFYHHDVSQGTQVMVLSSVSKKYIGVVYAGTDDFRTTLTDTDILLKPFGPLDDNAESILLPGDARVHAGFDNEVFQHNLFDILLNITTSLVQQYPKHRLFCTGHSLGGANAILTAVALTQSKLPTTITVINFGCPAVGNEAWRTAIHALSNVNIWRFVHGWDMVPRLPEYPFTHVGHTLQMNEDAMRAYYLHRGNASLGYASVPYGWSGMSLCVCKQTWFIPPFSYTKNRLFTCQSQTIYIHSRCTLVSFHATLFGISKHVGDRSIALLCKRV